MIFLFMSNACIFVQTISFLFEKAALIVPGVGDDKSGTCVFLRSNPENLVQKPP